MPCAGERMPHELPHGVSAEGLGLRPASSSSGTFDSSGGSTGAPAAERAMAPKSLAAPMLFDELEGADDEAPSMSMPESAAAPKGRSMNKIDLKARLAKSPAPASSAPMDSPRKAASLGAPAEVSKKKAEVAAPKKGGLVEAVKRFFGGSKEKAAEVDEGAPAPDTKPSAPRRLRGRIVLQKSSEVVIEVEVSGEALEWDPDCRVEITLADGRVLQVGVIAARSTRAGRLPEGTSLRLALPVPPGTKPESIRHAFPPPGRRREHDRRSLMDLDAHLSAIALGDAGAFGRWLAGAEPRLRDSLRPFAARGGHRGRCSRRRLLRAWQVAPRHAPDGRPNSLLRLSIRIARNLCIDEIRRVRSSPMDDEALEQALAAAEGATARSSPDPFLRNAIEECRDKLPGKPAEALRARLGCGGAEPDETLAERLGMRLNTFLQNFGRARKLLAECLEKRKVDIEAELS